MEKGQTKKEMMQSNIQQKLISSLITNPNRQKWDFIYDSEVDNFYLVPNSVPRDAQLFSLNDEVSLYLNKDKEVVGLMIEYFSSNFTEHKKEYKEILRLLKKVDGIEKVKEKSKQKAEVFKRSLVTDVLQQIAVA